MSEKLLIIDDDDFVLKTIKNSLTEEECQNIDFCYSPEEGIEKLSENDYKRVISDWRFPESELSGLDVLKKASEYGLEEKILMTSVSRLKNIAEADSFCGIRKPLSKSNVQKMCFDEYDTLEKMSSICR